MNKDHMFVVCAYKESPFLESAVLSVLNQTLKTKVSIATSTPNLHIKAIAKKYDLELFINEQSLGIAEDWNFALSKAKTSYVTLCHQDDKFELNYLEKIFSKIDDSTLIAFSDYSEIRGDRVISSSLLLNIKKIMLSPFLIRPLQKNILTRRVILSFGCPICCPSVTFSKKNLTGFEFDSNFKCNLDWQAWEKISRRSGKFIYVNDMLFYHRIHTESETSASIASNVRTNEDLSMFQKFWPNPVAKLLQKLYSFSLKSNS